MMTGKVSHHTLGAECERQPLGPFKCRPLYKLILQPNTLGPFCFNSISQCVFATSQILMFGPGTASGEVHGCE